MCVYVCLCVCMCVCVCVCVCVSQLKRKFTIVRISSFSLYLLFLFVFWTELSIPLKQILPTLIHEQLWATEKGKKLGHRKGVRIGLKANMVKASQCVWHTFILIVVHFNQH